jgi:hypothetical protein
MSDTGDPQDEAEALDADVLDDESDDPEGDLTYPLDRALGAEDYGTTAAEERVDEPYAESLRREVPERRSDRQAPGRIGRLVEPGADDDADYPIDLETDLVALAADEDELDLSAEEAAIHLTRAPRYHDDDEDEL